MNLSQTLTARTPADLLAAVPCVLGFHPHESLVMLTFARAGHAFHARVDLPEDPGDLPELCAVLLDAAVSNRVDRAVLIAYTEREGPARAALEAVHDAFDARDIDVVELLRADGARWWQMRDGLPSRWYGGVPYDVTSHPFLAQTVLAGRVTLGSREELVATLEPSAEAVRETQRALAARAAPLAEGQRPAEARWLVTTVREYVDSGAPMPTAELARLLADCRDLQLRDAVWALMSRKDATRHLDFWRAVLRRTPAAWSAAPAGLLAFAAWLSGQGALAWCAVDRCREAEPEDPLAAAVADLLAAAVPPRRWRAAGRGDLPGLGLDA